MALGDVIHQEEEEDNDDVDEEPEASVVSSPEVVVSEPELAPAEYVPAPIDENVDEDAESTTLVNSAVSSSPMLPDTELDYAYTPRSSSIVPSEDAYSDDGEVTITQFRDSYASASSGTSGLLSPIEMASAPLTLPQRRISAEVHRGDSFDSGYADSCCSIGPVPATFMTSPPQPRSVRLESRLSVLSSPFSSPATRAQMVGIEPRVEVEFFSPRMQPARTEPQVTVSDEPDHQLDVAGEVPQEQPAVAVAVSSPVEAEPWAASPVMATPAVNALYDGYLDDEADELSALPSPFDEPPRPPVFTAPSPSSSQESEQETRGRSPTVVAHSSRGIRVDHEIKSSVHSPEGSVGGSVSQSRERSWDNRASSKVPLAWRRSTLDRSTSVRQTSTAPQRSPDTLDRSTSLAAKQAQTPGTVRARPPALAGIRSPSGERMQESQLRDLQLLSPEEKPARISGGGLRPLRLSMILTSPNVSFSSSSTPATSSFGSASSVPPPLTTGTTAYTPASFSTPSSPTVSSEYSLSHNQLLSSRPSSSSSNHIPAHRNTLLIDRKPNTHVAPLHTTVPDLGSAPRSAPISRPPSSSFSWNSRRSSRFSSVASRRLSQIDAYARPDSRLSEPGILYEDDEDNVGNDENDWQDDTIRRPASSLAHVAHAASTSSFLSPPSPAHVHAIATPRPTLMFALASDDVGEVRRVLESGEAQPNDAVGPQTALAFTLTSTQLNNRIDMVKLLLAHGADPSAVMDGGVGRGADTSQPGENVSPSRLLESLDPATRYYVKRAAAPQTRRASALIHRSFFRPLARVRYDLIGQDRALEQLFRVLSMPSMAPIVVLFCGPSGHGKSLLARKFGSLLDVPTHTVNMTTLRSTHDIWRSYSMSPYEASSTCTLAEFLISNEGKRCVVVLDEIEKVEDKTFLSSLLMPWELGRCSFEAGQRHVDVSQVIWLGTSNVGHELVFEHQESRQDPSVPMSREEYVDLMALLRPRVSDKLGPSLLSRVTTVLPFVPFVDDEKMAVAAEAVYSLAGDAAATLPPATVDMVVRKSLSAYLPAEGARSLYRAVSTLLLDTI